MKRNKLISLLLLLVMCLAVLFTGCEFGSYLQYGTDKPPADSGSQDDPGGSDPALPDNSSHYTVTVFYGSRPLDASELDITVVWRNDGNVIRRALGANGEADAGELDGDFAVYLSGLPEAYAYNPNGYKATSESRHVSILLTTPRKPSKGNGGGLYVSEGCYHTRDEGVYRVSVNRENQVLYYEFQPSGAGVYTVESWVNVYDDKIDPYLDLYSGTSANKMYNRKLEGGGASLDGGFTKNFRWEISIDKNEVSGSFTFAVGAVSKEGEYPVYVDFAITWIGEYVSEYADIRTQSAKEARGSTADPKAGETFVFADLGTKVFDAGRFKKSPVDGRYHLYDEALYADNQYKAGRGYGPMLLCAITKAIPSYTVVPSLYNANSVGPNGANYLMLYNTWVEEEQKFAVFDYTNFIRVDYYGVCNRDGVCYVTDELIAFLQKFAENHALYTDGVGAGSGTPEMLGYTANQDSLWLFACGIYR